MVTTFAKYTYKVRHLLSVFISVSMKYSDDITLSRISIERIVRKISPLDFF